MSYDMCPWRATSKLIFYLLILLQRLAFLLRRLNDYQGTFFTGKSNDLYDIVISKDITVVKGCGLGGTSLINANVVLDADENVFSSKHWPKEIRDDMKDLQELDRKRVFKMLQPTKYPEDYPALDKIGAMQKVARSFFPDIEDLRTNFRRTPL